MTVTETAHAFEHDAFLYGSDDDYVDVLAPLLSAAVNGGDGAFAVVSRGKADLLRDALGDDREQVEWIDAGEWYRKPATTIAGYDAVLRGIGPGRRPVVIGEVQFGATAPEWRAWTRYEAVLNRALDRHTPRVICPYDIRALPPVVVDDAYRTHPHLVGPATRQPSSAFVAPEALLVELGGEAVVPARHPDLELRDERSVRVARHAFAAAASRAGLGGRTEELVVAVNEVLTNALVHGGGAASLRVWVGDGTLDCVVDDAGTGADDPLLGFLPPDPGAAGGYGLWLTRQVFDHVELARSPAGGLRVHVAVRA